MIGIFLLMAAENVFPPIPSEIVLTCAGFLTTCSKLTKPQAIISATLGSLLGAVILYGLGRILPVEKLQKFGFKREEIESATAWFNKKGKIAVLLCRCVPVVRSLISVPAGAARMPMSSFLPLTVLGTLAWDAVLILVGAAAGASWKAAAGKFHYDSAFLLLIAFSLLVTGLPFYYLYKKEKNNRQLKNCTSKLGCSFFEWFILRRFFPLRQHRHRGNLSADKRLQQVQGQQSSLHAVFVHTICGR